MIMTMIVVKMSVIFLSWKLLVILIIFIIIKTIGDHGRHFITDSACNALYVFPDKTLRAQSENQSPRWCYQTEKEKRDFFRLNLSDFFGEKNTPDRYTQDFIQSSCPADFDIVTLILIQLVLLSPPLSRLSGVSGNTKTASDRLPCICKPFILL